MKGKRKYVIIGSSMILILALLVSTTMALTKDKEYAVYRGMDSAQVIDHLMNMDFEEMTNEIKNVFNDFYDVDGINALLPFSTAFAKRINEYTEDEILSLVQNAKTHPSFRSTILQIYGESYQKKTSETCEAIKNMLNDENLEAEIKETIILGFDFSTKEDIEKLIKVARDKDDMLAFQAIKKMDGVDSIIARDISNEILSNYSQETPEKVNAALKVKAKEYREMRIKSLFTESIKKQKLDFISLCTEIIENTGEKDKLKDSAIFALSEMTDSNAVAAILSNEKIEDLYKVYAVDQNYLTLVDMISGDYSKNNIETVCQAMSIYPINELGEKLIELKNKSTLLTSDEKIDIERALISIKENGESANHKWNEYYYGNEVER